jgi:tRNA nucleotidyltransferase (CCA-adding enzyme)
LGEKCPSRFFEVLRACGALRVLFPELEQLFGVPQPREHHPEIDTGVHVLQVLDRAAQLSADARVRFAALLHDLGKGITPRDEWPRHVGHEQRGLALIEDLCQRLRAPNEYRELALLTAKYHGVCHRAEELRPATLLDTLQELDAMRRPERFEQFLLACEADSTGRPGYENQAYPQADLLRRMLHTALAVNAAALAATGLKGETLAEELRRQRIAAIRAARAQEGAVTDDSA